MSYDYSKLSGKIIEVFGSRAKFSEAMGLSERSTSLKLNSKVWWKQSEIERACSLLGIDRCNISDYFFVAKVQRD